MRNDQVNLIPEIGQWIFQTWKIDFFTFTLLDLTISGDFITICVRTGHRIFKWEYRRKPKP